MIANIGADIQYSFVLTGYGEDITHEVEHEFFICTAKQYLVIDVIIRPSYPSNSIKIR